jgi:transcriptional regulator with XRE-family HTH domain
VNYFGKNLRYLREKNNLTQDDMKPLLGIRNTRCSNYENNVSEPAINVLIKISKYFGVSLDALLLEDLRAQGDAGANKERKHHPYITNNAAALVQEQTPGLHHIVKELKKLRKEVDAIKRPAKKSTPKHKL